MEFRTTLVTLALAASACLLFAIDLLLPFGVAAGIPYVMVVLLAAWMPRPRMPLYVAALCSALIVVGGLWSPAGGVTWMGITNRVLGVAILWITAVLILLRRRTEERLRRVNRELDAFVHTVSHDLRSPLSPVIGYAEYLREHLGESAGEEGKEMLDQIARQGRRMEALLSDLLQFATAGSLARPSEPVDVETVVRQVFEEWRERAAAAGCELRCRELPPVTVPESLLAQIFDNLVGNAVRYAGGGPVEVGGERGAGRVRYHVRDRGPGISPGERESIFEAFRRGASGESIPGTGIGLATVRKIALHYGGRAWVEETPGGGSTFLVELAEPRR